MIETDATLAPLAYRRVTMHGPTGAVDGGQWGIVGEVPVQMSLNGEPWTVLMATPIDLPDLALGLCVTEGLLRDPSLLPHIEMSSYLHDVAVNVVIPDGALDQAARLRRTVLGNSSCGLCGVESLAQLQQRAEARRPHAGVPRIPVADHAIRSAFSALSARQPLNAATRSSHAAAWCSLDGTIVTVREDVGRHNALDKLIGALAHQKALADSGFIVMTSRCSYELVYKASAATCQLLATVSAPTTMALSWADALSLPLACTMPSRGGDVTVVHFPLGVS